MNKIYCCRCEKKVDTEIVDGGVIYTHRQDLKSKFFHRCLICKNFVGCHDGTQNTLGVIPTSSIRNARRHIHSILDPLYKSGKIKRKDLYKMISDKIGFNYHTANLRSIDECRKAYLIVKDLTKIY